MDDQNDRYRVVFSLEQQYSIWPDDAEPPGGWYSADVAGSRAECLSYIAEVWTDMRPASLRNA
jgi:MbtH protein